MNGRVGWAVLALIVGAGCTSRDPDPPVDPGRDAGMVAMDAAAPDAPGVVRDTGTRERDAGRDAPGPMPDAGACVSPREICVDDGVEVCANLLSDENHCG